MSSPQRWWMGECVETTKIVFWQNMPAIHQAPLVPEVARQAGVPVYVLVADDVSAVRREQGWRRPDFEPAVLHIKPDDTVTTRLLREDPDTTVHIFSGIHAYPFRVRRLAAGVRNVGHRWRLLGTTKAGRLEGSLAPASQSVERAAVFGRRCLFWLRVRTG